ncbi:MAG: hydroxyacylglutathione hydrolase [Deltaproteobacteria bacterium]|nr:hydroxyacylglutathione hydrolase [Deltaproteobacteria bacterium]
MTTLRTLPAWNDNYVHLLSTSLAKGEKDVAVVVDPTDANVVLAALEEHSLNLRAILLTHHHPDHILGVEELVETTGCEVIGNKNDAERLPATRWVLPQEEFEVGPFSFRVLDVKAHTLGHIAYIFAAPVDEVIRQAHGKEPHVATELSGNGALFSGDALFLGGCGRLFEGAADNLFSSMKTFWDIEQDLLVCCAHEYTESNLKFAEHILPKGAPLDLVRERLSKLELQGVPSVPDLLSKEKKSNPFLLCADPTQLMLLRQATSLAEDASATRIVSTLRSLKDQF